MLMVFDHCLEESVSGRQTLMEKLLAYPSSHMFVYFVFLLALNFVFSKTKMFKLILLVIKQLSGNVTSDIDIYSAKQGIIRRRQAEW